MIMRKIIGIVVALILILLGASWLVWEKRTSVAAHFISKHLGGVPVDIQVLDITKTEIDIQDLWIGTPSNSRTHTSFSAKTIDVSTETPKILNNPLIIDQINIANIFVGLEYYQDGTTNWTHMLGEEDSSKAEGRDYLIRTLVLENLTVEVVQANGRKKRYPTIRRMQFHNISNETGIPIGEIEKAIFRLMMKDLMDKFNLFQQPLDIPRQLLPNLFK